MWTARGGGARTERGAVPDTGPWPSLLVWLLLLAAPLGTRPSAHAAQDAGEHEAGAEIAAELPARPAETLQDAGPPQGDAPAVRELPAVVVAYRALVELREPELASRAAALLLEDPEAARDALLLRAGADPPPGATTAQRAQHAALSAEALAFVRSRMDLDPGVAQAWIGHIRARLADPLTEDLLWSAAARTAGELRLYALADDIGAGLSSERPIRPSASRAALHRLFVRWFASREEFAAFWAPLGDACRDDIFYGDLVERDRLARDRLVELLELDASRVQGHLGDPDPRVRAAAARSSARAVAARRAEVAPAIEALSTRLEREGNAQAFHAQLEALLELLAGSPPDAPELERLRACLIGRIGERHVYLAPSVAHGLSRMPWAPDGSAPPAALERRVEGVALLVLELAAPERVVQPEALVAVLQAARSLFGRCQEVGLSVDALAERVRAVGLSLLADPEEVRSVRLVAAQLLARIARPADIEALAEVLERSEGNSPDLRLSLLGTLAGLAREVGPDDERGARVLAALERHLDSPLADLRARALGLLLEDGLEAFAARADLGRVVRRLDEETSSEVAGQLLAFLARHGGSDQLAAILASPAVDRLALDSARRTRLIETLARLAGGDGERMLAVVERLLAVADPDSRARRLQQGLELVASLPDQAASLLSVARHDQVVAWARELREATGARFELGGLGERFLRRLVGLHLVRATPPAPDDGGGAHFLALLLADLHATDPQPEHREGALAAFDRALRRAELGQGCSLEAVLRDRARFRHATGDLGGARSDYERAITVQRAALRGTAQAVPQGGELEAALASALDQGDLDLGDLRRAVELLRAPLPPEASSDGPAPSPAAVRLAARDAGDLALAMVSQALWRFESPPVRVSDLELVVDLVLAADDPARLERALTLLADLPPLPELPPETPAAQPPAPASESGPWSGLLVDRALHARLLAARERLAHPRPVDASAPAPLPEVPPDGPSPLPEPPG